MKTFFLPCVRQIKVRMWYGIKVKIKRSYIPVSFDFCFFFLYLGEGFYLIVFSCIFYFIKKLLNDRLERIISFKKIPINLKKK